MNLKQAEYLKTIAEEGSITAAARKLYISQPSLSQTLKQIEDEMGVTIFDRSVSPHQITYAGRVVLEAAETMLRQDLELKNRIRRMKNEQEGILRLGISVQRSMQIVPHILPVFLERYPHVRIELTEAGSARLEDMLIMGRLDLALAAVEPSSPRVRYELIEKETIGILAGKNNPLAKMQGTEVDIADLADGRFVALRPGHSVRLVQDRMFHEHGIQPQIVIETDSFEMARRAALEADLCMFCSDIFVDAYARRKGVFFPLKGYENKRDFYACSKQELELPRYSRDLIDITRSVLQKGTGAD